MAKNSMITFESHGSFKKTESFLAKMRVGDVFKILEKYGEKGVAALAAATPVDTGETSQSWSYEIRQRGGSHSIVFHNSHIVNGVNIAIILQYGHATGSGGYVQGRDYINPAIQPIFDQLADEVWRAVTTA